MPLVSPGRRSVLALVAFAAVLLAAAATLFTSIWIGLGALAIVALAFAATQLWLRRLRTSGWVVLDDAGVRRVDRKQEISLASWGEPFGVAVLANHARTRALLAFTSPTHTRFIAIGPAQGEADAVAAREIITFAATVADADVLRHDEGALSPAHAAELLRALRARAPESFGRIFLTGAAGDDLVLEERELRCGERLFDLRSPLEWKGFTFHESMGPVGMVYQATWVRQGASELVVVAPLAPEISIGRLPHQRGHAFLRDFKLMQSASDQPPPRELRFAIERVFMLPLRQALDRAPRASRPTSPPSSRLSAHG